MQKTKQEDKASEVIAATELGITFGGKQTSTEGQIIGKFVSCKIKSIEQI